MAKSNGTADVKLVFGAASASFGQINKDLAKIIERINQKPPKIKIGVKGIDRTSLNNVLGQISSKPPKIKIGIKGIDKASLNNAKASVEKSLGNIKIKKAPEPKAPKQKAPEQKSDASPQAKIQSASLLKDVRGRVKKYSALADSDKLTENDVKVLQSYIKRLQDIEKATKSTHTVEDIRAQREALDNSVKKGDVKILRGITSYKEQPQLFLSSFKKLDTERARIKKELDSWTIAEGGKSSKDYDSLYQSYLGLNKIRDGMLTGKVPDDFGFDKVFSEVTQNVKQYEAAIKGAGENTGSLFSKIKDVGGKLLGIFGTARVIQAAIRYGQQMFETVKDIDGAMTQLKIVTGASDSEMRTFLRSATGLAKELGQSITNVLGSIETFSRLGYGLTDATELAKYANILANVANVSSDEATTGLTSIIKGYNLDVSQSEHVADVLVEVGQKYAVSASEMIEAYEKSGAALNATNTSFEKSAGLIAAANASVQNASTVGTALKTVSARIRGSKTELSDIGADAGDISDIADGFSKYAKELQAITGFNIMQEGTTNKFKDIYDIFEGIAGAWGNLSDTQQARVAEILGGTRQLQVISSIIGNWSDAANAYSDAMNSAGVSTKAEATYMDSIEGKIGQINAALQEVSTNLLESESVKFVLDLAKGFLSGANAVAQFVNALGGIKPIVAGLGIAGLIKVLSLLPKTIAGIPNTLKHVFQALIPIKHNIKEIEGQLTIEGFGIAGEAGEKVGLGKSITSAWSAASLASRASAVAGIVAPLVSLGVSLYSAWAQSQEEARRSAREAGDEFRNEVESIDSYREKIASLKESIASGNLSYEESANARKDLLSIQDEMIAKYGEEAYALDLVRGSADDANESLDELESRLATAKYMENEDAFKGAVTEMEKVREYTPLATNINPRMLNSKPLEDLKSLFSKYDAVVVEDFAGTLEKGFQIRLRGTASQISDTAVSLYKDLDDLRRNYSHAGMSDIWTDLGSHGEDVIEFLQSGLIQAKDSQKSILDTYEQIYNDGIALTISKDEDYSAVMDRIKDAKEALDDALTSGDLDDLAAAYATLDSIKLDVTDIDNRGVREYMDKAIEEIESKYMVAHVKVKLVSNFELDGGGDKNNIDGAITKLLNSDGKLDVGQIKELEQLSVIGVHTGNGYTQDQWDGFSRLNAIAKKYGVTISDLIEALEDLNLVQLSTSDGISNITTQINSYEALKSSAEAYQKSAVAMNDVMGDGAKLSEDAYKAIAELAGGEDVLSDCVDKANGFIVTNAEKLKDVVAQSKLLVAENARVAASHEKLNYHNLVDQLHDLVTAEAHITDGTHTHVQAILKEIRATERLIGKYSQLEVQMSSGIDFYNELSASKSLDEDLDYSDKLSEAIQSALEPFSSGEFGTNEFQTAIDSLVPDSVFDGITDSAEKLEAAKKYLNDAIGNFYSIDDNGNISIGYDQVKNFLQAGFENESLVGDLSNFEFADGIDSLEDLAEKYGMTESAIYGMLTAIQRFSDPFKDNIFEALLGDDGSTESKINKLDKELSDLLEKREALARAGKVGDEYAEWVETNNAIAQNEGDRLSLYDEVQQHVVQYDRVSKDIIDANNKITEIKRKQKDATAKEYEDLETQAQTAGEELQRLLNRLPTEPTEFEIKVAHDSAVEEIEKIAKFDEKEHKYVLKEEYKKDPDKDKELKDLQQVIDITSSKIKSESDLVTESLEAVNDFKIGDKTFSVKLNSYSYQSTIDRLNYLRSLMSGTEVEVTTRLREPPSGFKKVDDGGSAAMASGGTLSQPTRDVLTGELGREIVVDPHSGTYKIVGASGPELTDLPKDAIVFNNAQTEKILRGGKGQKLGRAFSVGVLPDLTGSPSAGSGGSSGYTGGSSGGSSTDTSSFDDLMSKLEHKIFLIEKKRGDKKEIVAIYERMLREILAEKERYLRLGEAADSEAIRELEKKWWECSESIRETMVATYEDIVTEMDNAISHSQGHLDNAFEDEDLFGIEKHSADIISYLKRKQDSIHAEADYYRSIGYDENSDEITKLGEEWNKCADDIKSAKDKIVDYLMEIVNASSNGVDDIQKVSDTLNKASEEFDKYGSITVDTFQEISDMGLEYMQMLRDENGLLTINKEKLQDIAAAKVRKLAIDNAAAYVERVILASQRRSAEELSALTGITVSATNATFAYLKARLEMANASGELGDDYFRKALSNVNLYEQLALGAQDNISSGAEQMAEDSDALIKYVMDMLKQRVQDQIDALGEMKDAFGDIISLRKEALDAAKEEADYDDEVSEKVKEIAKLQSRINALSLDDSRSSQAQRAKLEEDMAKLQKELSKSQSDHAVDAQKESLDKMKEVYDEEKDAEIEKLEDTISSYQKLYEQAINYIIAKWNGGTEEIRGDWVSLYQELAEWNTQYGSVLNSEIGSAWANLKLKAQEYGDYLDELKQKAYFDPLAPITPEGSGTSSGSSSSGSSGAVATQKPVAQPTREEQIHAAVHAMYMNSQNHGASSKEDRKKLHASNVAYAQQLNALGVRAVFGDDGYWYVDRVGGEKLYEKYKEYTKYHTGGIVGDNPNIKQKEMLALLEKGEAVLDRRKETGLYRLVDFATVLSEKLGKSIDISSLISTKGLDLHGSTAIKAKIPDRVPSTIGNIHFGDVTIYGATSDTVAKHKEINRKFVDDVLGYLKVKR